MRLPSTHVLPKLETGWHCALHHSCSYSCFVTEITDPYVIQRRHIKPGYPSNGSSEIPPTWLFALYFPISASRAGRRRRSAGRWMKCRSRRSPLFSGARRVTKTSKGGSRHCAGGPSLAGSGSARHTCVWLLHMSPRYRIRARVSRTPNYYNRSRGRLWDYRARVSDVYDACTRVRWGRAYVSLWVQRPMLRE